MRNFLLFLLIAVIAWPLSAQKKNFGPSAKEMLVHPDYITPLDGTVIGQKMYDNTIIGTTWYDIQTLNYGNVMPRVWLYEDGTIGATWTCAGEDLVPNRGIGYNYYDGSEWGTPDLHVGPEDRHGTVCYAPWGANGEIACTYQYIAGESPILFFRREVKGQGEWIQSQANGPEGVSLVWQSMMTSGENHEYIHLLAYTYDQEYMGQANALLYYRSNDGGETWDPDGIIIDGLGSDYVVTINALSYNFSNSVGSTIAFTYGFDQFGGFVFKSTDNGENWDMMVAMESPIDPFDYPDEVDPFGAGIGSSAIALDSQGKAHVVFPRMVRSYSNPDWNYYPWTTDGLIYWNEDMDPLDSTIISTTGLQNLEDGGYLCGYVFGYDPEYGTEVPTGQPTYANAMCGFPVISIDNNDNIFVASSNFSPDYLSGEGYLYRHIVANSSFDGGQTWNGMVDLNDEVQFIFSECAFPTMPYYFDNTVYFLFQEDFAPGTFEWPNEQPEASENHMYMMSVPKSVFVGINENEQTLNSEMSDLYPNPANNSVNFSLIIENNASVAVHVMNSVGQIVLAENVGFMAAGTHRLGFDVSTLDAGIYYCTVNVDGQTTSRKLVVY